MICSQVVECITTDWQIEQAVLYTCVNMPENLCSEVFSIHWRNPYDVIFFSQLLSLIKDRPLDLYFVVFKNIASHPLDMEAWFSKSKWHDQM
jgi:hypothetical protein